MNAHLLRLAFLCTGALLACGASPHSSPSAGGGAGSGSVGLLGAGAPAAISACGGAASGGAVSTLSGSIVPLYRYPDAASWQAIVSAKALHPQLSVIAIVNPDNGSNRMGDVPF